MPHDNLYRAGRNHTGSTDPPALMRSFLEDEYTLSPREWMVYGVAAVATRGSDGLS